MNTLKSLKSHQIMQFIVHFHISLHSS